MLFIQGLFDSHFKCRMSLFTRVSLNNYLCVLCALLFTSTTEDEKKSLFTLNWVEKIVLQLSQGTIQTILLHLDMRSFVNKMKYDIGLHLLLNVKKSNRDINRD